MLRDVGAEAMLETRPRRPTWSWSGPEGEILQVVPDLAFPNGTVITPDGATLIVGETLASSIERLRHRRRRHAVESARLGPARLGLHRRHVPRRRGTGLARQRHRPAVPAREGGRRDHRRRRDHPERLRLRCSAGTMRRSLYVMTAPTSSRFVVADQLLGRIEAAEVAVPGATTDASRAW